MSSTFTNSVNRHLRQSDGTGMLRVMIWIGTIFLLLMGVWYLIRLALLIVAGPDVPVPININPVVRQSTLALPNKEQIANWHLFGESSNPELISFGDLPPTPLNLSLRGIVSGEESDKTGYAIIIDDRGNEWVYGVGDKLTDNTEVLAIQPHQVVLERNGVRESLALPLHDETANNNSRGNSLATARQNPAQRFQSPRIGQPVNRLPSVARTGVPSVSLADLNVTDFSSIAKSIQVRPVTGGGFRVFPGRDATVFRQLGLQANDVVTAVNGQPLTDMQAALSIFQQTDNIAGVTISVRRGTEVIQLQPDTASIRQ